MTKPRTYRLSIDATVSVSPVHVVEYTLPDPAAVMEITNHDTWTEFEVVAVKVDVDRVHFLSGNEPGAFCVPMTLNAEVRYPLAKPGNGVLDGVAYKNRGGIVGARVGVTCNGTEGLKDILAASNLWKNKRGGPYVIGTPAQSYLLSAPDYVTPANVDTWIEICQACKIMQLDWTHCFRYGDYRPWRAGQ
ncbi:unnamed protein product, partial [marine sediment metagenome]